MLSISLPILLALSLISVIAMFAYSTAAAVSPPKPWRSEAENDVASSMYWLALIPAVAYALLAYAISASDDSWYRVSIPPTSCSYDA